MELFQNLKKQKHQTPLFSIKLIVFITLVFVIDRYTASFLKEGLYQYFGLDKSAEVLAVGHSHTVLGIDKQAIENKLHIIMAKYARSGANLQDRKAMIEQYFNLQPKSAKVVIYDVDAHLFTEGGLSRNSYQEFYPFIDTPLVKEHILLANPSWQEVILREIFQTSRYSEMLVSESMRGRLKKWTNLKYGRVDIDRLKKEIANGISQKIEFNEKSIALFMDTLKVIKNNGAIAILVYIPTVDIMNEAEPEKFRQIIALFEKIAKEDKSVYFLNYNEPFSHQHNLFFDPVHLNPQGQKIITESIINDLENIRKIDQ